MDKGFTEQWPCMLGNWQSKMQLYKHFEFLFSHQNIRGGKVLCKSIHRIARSPADAKVASFCAEANCSILAISRQTQHTAVFSLRESINSQFLLKDHH